MIAYSLKVRLSISKSANVELPIKGGPDLARGQAFQGEAVALWQEADTPGHFVVTFHRRRSQVFQVPGASGRVPHAIDKVSPAARAAG